MLLRTEHQSIYRRHTDNQECLERVREDLRQVNSCRIDHLQRGHCIRQLLKTCLASKTKFKNKARERSKIHMSFVQCIVPSLQLQEAQHDQD